MTSPPLSPDQQEQAKRIYKRGLWVGYFLAFATTMLLTVIVTFIERAIFHSRGATNGWAAGTGMLVIIFARWFATRQVRRAGLSQDKVEHRVVPKTAAHFRGEPIALYSPNSMKLGILGLLLSGGMLLILWNLQRSSEPYSQIIAVLMVLFFVLTGFGALYLLSDPASLIMDSEGIQGSKNGYWNRRVPWEQVATIEIRQVFNYNGSLQLQTLIFRDQANTTLIKVPLSSLIIKPEQVNDFIAKVEAKLINDIPRDTP